MLRKYNVLIADDEPEDRFLLKLVIRKRAPRLEVVGEVADGEKVVDYLSGNGPFADRQRHPFPDLLILDLRMPLMDGHEVLAWLKTQNLPPLAVAVLAAPSPETNRFDVLRSGVDHYFPKTAELHDLEQMLRALEESLAGKA